MAYDKEARALIGLAEHMPVHEVEALAQIANLETKVDPTKPLDNLMIWLCEVISRIMTIKNTDKTQYSPAVEADIETALIHLVDRDAMKEFAEEDLTELQTIRDATKDVLKTHFKETFVGTKAYQPVSQLPVVEWAWKSGSMLMRLSAFTSLFFLSQQASETRH